MDLLQLLAELEALKQSGALVAGSRHTTPTGAVNASLPYYTGPGGLFNILGLDRELISTRMMNAGLAARLPVRGTNTIYPYFPYITGFLDPSGSNPNAPCDDGPVAGPAKSCIQTAQFGRYTGMTRELDITRVGRLTNDAEFDLTLVNPPLLQGTGTITTPTVPGSPNLRDEVGMRFLELGQLFQNKLTRQVYTANPANNSAQDGYREFAGLDILIGTSKIDAFTGVSCPSLASDIKNMNYALVDTNGPAVVNALTYLMRTLRTTASGTNLGPVTWALVMRETLFYELTAVWPCSYLTERCALPTGGVLNMDAGDQIRMRDEMRNGQYLMIDGMRVDVILDDAIVEETQTTNNRVGPGAFASDIYVIPLTYAGGRAATYWEYFDFSTSGAVPAGNGAAGLAQNNFYTDRGQYLFHFKPPKNWCIQWIAVVEPRLVLRTPHLAGRLNHVQYKPLQHPRDSFSDQPYFVNGGVSTGRYTTSTWAEWGSVR